MTHQLIILDAHAVCSCSNDSGWSYTPAGAWDDESRQSAQYQHRLHKLRAVRTEREIAFINHAMRLEAA